MPDGLKRYYGRSHLHFLTFSCYRRLALLASPATRDLFLEELGRVRQEYGFELIGYVLMPNHVHLLVSEPSKGTLSTVLQMLKQRVSRKMRFERQQEREEKKEPTLQKRGWGTLGGSVSDLEELSRFWEKRFYDFNVYSHEKMGEKLDYMHANPVTRGLVQDARDWPWSSFTFYADGNGGLISIDPVDL